MILTTPQARGSNPYAGWIDPHAPAKGKATKRLMRQLRPLVEGFESDGRIDWNDPADIIGELKRVVDDPTMDAGARLARVRELLKRSGIPASKGASPEPVPANVKARHEAERKRKAELDLAESRRAKKSAGLVTLTEHTPFSFAGKAPSAPQKRMRHAARLFTPYATSDA